jgi:N utilization substance protein B
MATPAHIRRLAFQALFQLDVRGIDAFQDIRDAVLESEEVPEEFSEADRIKALELALSAFEHRAAADEETTALAPTWPSSRQPAVDRAILRLSHYELTKTDLPPKVSIDQAVELAKEFSTEKSPAFINGLLDRVYKRLQGHTNIEPLAPGAPEAPESTEPAAPIEHAGDN